MSQHTPNELTEIFKRDRDLLTALKAENERLRALLRRASIEVLDNDLLAFGDLEIRMKARTVYVKRAHVPVSPKEFELITFFGRNAGQVGRGPHSGVPVVTESAWIVPSAKRSATAALTIRCWSMRLTPSNWGAVTLARR